MSPRSDPERAVEFFDLRGHGFSIRAGLRADDLPGALLEQLRTLARMRPSPQKPAPPRCGSVSRAGTRADGALATATVVFVRRARVPAQT